MREMDFQNFGAMVHLSKLECVLRDLIEEWQQQHTPLLAHR